MTSLRILSMTREHWPAVREIFAQGIATGNATFETAVPDWPEWDARHLPTCRLVALSGEHIVGWTRLGGAERGFHPSGLPWSRRGQCVYRRKVTRERHRPRLARGARHRIGAQRHLDLAGGYPRCELPQHPRAPESRLPHSRHT